MRLASSMMDVSWQSSCRSCLSKYIVKTSWVQLPVVEDTILQWIYWPSASCSSSSPLHPLLGLRLLRVPTIVSLNCRSCASTGDGHPSLSCSLHFDMNSFSAVKLLLVTSEIQVPLLHPWGYLAMQVTTVFTAFPAG